MIGDTAYLTQNLLAMKRTPVRPSSEHTVSRTVFCVHPFCLVCLPVQVCAPSSDHRRSSRAIDLVRWICPGEQGAKHMRLLLFRKLRCTPR
ncbi:hypothetical protein BR93DRAFT_601391 [Coniochaeta sp. PMI_546]|nr:hypothetical protein BR93DRAFT_601391 [Coniochaeta sp. PMI_546]